MFSHHRLNHPHIAMSLELIARPIIGKSLILRSLTSTPFMCSMVELNGPMHTKCREMLVDKRSFYCMLTIRSRREDQV